MSGPLPWLPTAAVMGSIEAHLLYGLAWVSFGLGHSLLARPAVKALLRPWLGAAMRVVYSLVAVLHIALVLVAGWLLLGDLPAFALPFWAEALRYALLAVGLLVLVAAGRSYDLGRLLGTAQLREARAGLTVEEEEPFHATGLQRWIRHPLYAGGMLLLAGGALADPAGLATGIWGGLYLVIGGWFEQKDLARRFGPAYQDYCAAVPWWRPRLRPLP